MFLNTFRLSTFILAVCMLAISGCSDDDGPTPALVNFTNQEVGISSENTSSPVGITFSRPTNGSGQLQFEINPGDLTYGADNDFYTTPEAVGNVITLDYVDGAETAQFTISAGSGLNITEDKTLTIQLNDAGDAASVGTSNTVTATFSENFIAPSGTVELYAGGADFTKQAFVDLSKINSISLDIDSWDLGLYAEAGEFSVVLNSSAFVMARPLDKYDLTAVTAEDTVNFGYEMSIPPPNFDPSIGAAEWVDSPDGNLATTAFGEISSTDSENRVFILKRPEGKDWKKVRVLRNGEGYTVQVADIADETFESIEVTKDDAYNFTFVTLDAQEIEVEPFKDSWDIMYGSYTELLFLGPTDVIPYGYKDFITINRNQTKAAMVMTDDVAYEDFSAEDLAAVTFNSEVDAIGENWRSGGGPTSGPALYEDRFFVLEDSEGNTFKIKFTRLTSTTGERGYPEFIYELID